MLKFAGLRGSHQAQGSKLIFVLGGDVLRETSSLAKALRI